jgi:hypothetical protein
VEKLLKLVPLVSLVSGAVVIVGVTHSVWGHYFGPAYQMPLILAQNGAASANSSPSAPTGNAVQFNSTYNSQTNSSFNNQVNSPSNSPNNSNRQRDCNVYVGGSVAGSVTNGPCPK